ncbi:hypothetical protein [Actinocrispum wychmicini]|uniref:Uncharacterized protein n=1 Tax=Actinocrispum wychmicini TaxID=1213861 RepID=A0A4R2IPG4_9PSEU|nr:hypothetical protein [Actinocrispum wychmicini]TCO45878.1 hypothetical protein EV192_12064 [Actinocrispum wychmicini]
MRRRTFAIGAMTALGTSLAGNGLARAVTPTLSQFPPPPLPLGVPANIADILSKVTNLNDLLLLAGQTRIDGAVAWEASDITVYADMPGNPMPDKLPHGAELIHYTGLRASRLVRTGDLTLTRLSRILYVPVDPRTGNRITTWRNPVDGKERPVPPTFLRTAKRVSTLGEGRLAVGTPDAASAPGAIAPSVRGNLSWNVPLRQAHSLAEKFGITDDFGFGNHYTRLVSGQIAAPLLGTLPVLPVVVSAAANSSTIQPFPPETALAESDVRGRGLYAETAQSISDLQQAAPWLRELVTTTYPDLLTPPTSAETEWDDNRWVAFHREQLAPHGLTWREWCDRTPVT